MITKFIDLISIPVTDQDQAKEFYTKQLGFIEISDSLFDDNNRWIQLSPGMDAQTTISLVSWFEKMKPGTVQGLVLLTDNIIESHKVLTERGVELAPIEETPWGQFAYFQDPDGNGWMLHQNISPW